jgi:hypothetical protein
MIIGSGKEASSPHIRIFILKIKFRILSIEVLNVNAGVSVLLIFASLPDCSQNQTAVFDTLRSLSDF